MITNFEEYYETYGESLAARLAAIGHTEENKRFVFVDDTAKPTEVIRAATTSLPIGVSVLILEAFTDRLDDGGRDNYHRRIYGSLAVVRKEGTDQVSRKNAARIACAVATKICALMLRDAQEGILAQDGIVVEFGHDGEKFVLENGWVGWGYTFEWIIPIDLTLAEDDLVP